MKLHMTCGDIYLKDYTNIDIQGEIVVKGSVEGTTIHEYFKDREVGKPHPILVDELCDLRKLPLRWDSDSIDTIVQIDSMEHFTRDEAPKLLDEYYRILKKGGEFIVDFPDIVRTISECDDEWMVRLLYGSQKNDYSFHKWGYTKETFKKALGDKWSSIEFANIIPHPFPMQGCVATK